MRCVRCEFENMPSQARCIRCGSVLGTSTGAVAVHPPRMPAWKGPLRGTLRWLREHRLAPEKLRGGRISRGADRALSNGVVGLLLGVIPGLPHLLTRRFKEVALYVALWAMSLALGLFFYGSTPGSVLIGLAIGLHAWIALQYGVFREITELAARIGTVLAVMALLVALYWAVSRVAAQGLDAGYTTLTIPAMSVERGDLLLIHRVERGAGLAFPRGALVLFYPDGFHNAVRNRRNRADAAVVGQIAGLPGETIQVHENAYVADGQRLDPNRVPVPSWLLGRPWRSGISIPPTAYFISTEYTVHIHGNIRLDDAAIRGVCVVPAADIRGRAFLRRLPLARRGFLE